jgi:uncharacterized protein (UPF0335 family)
VAHDNTTNGDPLDAVCQDLVNRIERIDEEIKALRGDRTDLVNDLLEKSGRTRASLTNILKERKAARSLVHATYTDMDWWRITLKMRDPLLPPDEDDDEAGLNQPETDANGAESEPASEPTTEDDGLSLEISADAEDAPAEDDVGPRLLPPPVGDAAQTTLN